MTGSHVLDDVMIVAISLDSHVCTVHWRTVYRLLLNLQS